MVLDLFRLVFAAIFGVWLLSFVIEGVRRGRIRHTDSKSSYSFRQQPFRFLAVAFLFTAMGSVLCFYAMERGIALWMHFGA